MYVKFAIAVATLVLVGGAIDNVTTKLNGLSANYIMGRPPSIGTLYNEFQYDEAYISKNHNNITDVFDDLE